MAEFSLATFIGTLAAILPPLVVMAYQMGRLAQKVEELDRRNLELLQELRELRTELRAQQPS